MPSPSDNPSHQSAAPERMCIYVDGFNLYHGLHALGRRKYLWLDLVRLAEALRPKSEIARVKYFTADVVAEPDAASRQAHYINALCHRHRGQFQVIRGRYQTKTKKCLRCHTEWDHHEEKETDVNIAVHLLRDAMDKTYDSALIVSGDSDLGPAVRMVKDVRPGYFMAAAFPPKRFSAELKSLMPASFHINENKVRGAQLPQTFQDGLTSKTFTRPEKWI